MLNKVIVGTGILVTVSYLLLGMSHLMYALYGSAAFYLAFLLYLSSITAMMQVLYRQAPFAKWLSTTLMLMYIAISLFVLGNCVLPVA